MRNQEKYSATGGAGLELRVDLFYGKCFIGE